MDLSAAFLRELEAHRRRRAGSSSSREGRLTYESDMHTFYKGAPDVVVAARDGRAGRARSCGCAAASTCPIVPRGSGTGLIGGRDGARGRRDGRDEPHEPDPRAGLREPLRRRAARPHQPLAQPGHARARLLLRARPLEPDGVLDRRELLHQCRRPALPQVRDHGEPRARARRWSPGRGSWCGSAARRRTGPATTSPASMVGVGGHARPGDRGRSCGSSTCPRR